MKFFAGLLALLAAAQPVSIQNTVPTTSDDVNATISCSATPPGTSIVASSTTRQAIAIQNIALVVVCVSKSTTAMTACPPAAASATAGVWVLQAASGSGSTLVPGGALNFSQYSGPLFCLSSNGAALINALSFKR